MKILVVDGDWERRAIRRIVENLGVVCSVVLSASNVRDAEQLFDVHKDTLDAVVLSPCVLSDTPNTVEMVGRMRGKRFPRPIIVVSSDASHRARLIEAGCSHDCVEHKLWDTLVAVLLGPTERFIR